jgi:hypothetical protein
MMDKTWRDVAHALDNFIGRLLLKMVLEPRYAQYWQDEIEIAIQKKQEAMMLARQETTDEYARRYMQETTP